MRGYFARPATVDHKLPGIVVIHELMATDKLERLQSLFEIGNRDRLAHQHAHALREQSLCHALTFLTP